MQRKPFTLISLEWIKKMNMVLYNIAYLAALSALLPKEYLKRPSHLRKDWFKQRLGYYSSEIRNTFDKSNGPVIWIHAVSVGETICALPLVDKLYSISTKNIVISTVTDTGQEIAKSRTKGKDIKIIYVPFDTSLAVKQAFKTIKPNVLIIMETELWPALIHEAHLNKIPVILLNGRISNKSFKKYLLIKTFLKPVLDKITFFAMQDDLYAERIIKMGAQEKRVRNIGNLKYDVKPPTEARQWTKSLSSPVIVAGSTHDGEEEIILKAYKKLKKDIPRLSLILAPRHPQRFAAVESIIKNTGLNFIKRSQIENNAVNNDIVLLDTMGELSSVYGIADAAVMGGSFMPKGGHNLLEPAFFAKPIVCGPFMDNFPMAEEFRAKQACLYSTAETLYDDLKGLLRDEKRCIMMATEARNIYLKNAGSVDRAIEIINKFLFY
ncbi:3-deoxy-D-manno-octulosonic-acid transferase [Candidatus Magnetoovum chiemensis]|nr:3-deoxy-D-manno-octulosonic-acid transferase [Candidatus Magnetoovum chiemensis]